MFFLRQKKFSCVGVAEIIYNVGRLGLFVRAQPTFYIGLNWYVPIYSAPKNLDHLGKIIFLSRHYAIFLQTLADNTFLR